MRKLTRAITSGCIVTASTGWPALSPAGERSVTLSVERMACGACAYRVKRALEGIIGVKQAAVSSRDKTATVLFEDTQTDISALVEASGKIGFPATVKK